MRETTFAEAPAVVSVPIGAGAATARAIPLSAPARVGREVDYVAQALAGPRTAGGGAFTARASTQIESLIGGGKVFLTTSGTAALDMAAILADLKAGDEVIMPSFTFSSTANSVILRGAVPVFVDIRPDTLNIDENLIERAITPRTKAISVVHYAGVACDMDAIEEVAHRRGLVIIEDAAQALCAHWRERPLGRFGALAAFSFHDTKNLTCGEGGALVINREDLVERAEVLWEKGTNRVKFSRGEISKYTWIDVGSSFLPSEVTAAYLSAQLEKADDITKKRLKLWRRYHDAFETAERTGLCRRPAPPSECVHNGHVYYLLAPSESERARWLRAFHDALIGAAFHFVPLHSAPAGEKYCRTMGSMEQTVSAASRLVRLPMYHDLTKLNQDRVIAEAARIMQGR